jgi:hypothetical protein
MGIMPLGGSFIGCFQTSKIAGSRLLSPCLLLTKKKDKEKEKE